MSPESVKDFYNRQYRTFGAQKRRCPHAVQDLGKAQRRVSGVLRGFGVEGLTESSTVLDVGSGLGYYTKALSETGATVTGMDFSEAAIDASRATFPECRFVQGSWPDDVASGPGFDLIWMVNFSLMNTFDVDQINEQLIGEALKRLKPGGHLVVGWNSNFSGRTVEGYSHWSIRMLAKLRTSCGLSTPLVTEVRTRWLSWFLIRAAYLKQQSLPIFMIVRVEPK